MKFLNYGIVVFLGLSSIASAGPAEHSYYEVYPGISPKFEFIARKYCKARIPIQVKEFYQDKDYPSTDKKTTPVRVIHIYAETNQYECKNNLTEDYKMKLILAPVNKMTHIYLTTIGSSDSLFVLNLETTADLKQSLPQIKDKDKKYYTKSQIIHKYASEVIWVPEIAKEAESYAKELLRNLPPKKDWNTGNIIHHANLVLGRLELIKGNIKEAKKYLELAGKTPGSPQLDTFGPNMTLAKELLYHKETAAVLNYFDLCLKFWTMPDSKKQVEEWKKIIQSDVIPDFGAHLVY